MKVQVDQQKNLFVQAEVTKCHNKIPSNLVKISLNIAVFVDFSHFPQNLTISNKNIFWPKSCGFEHFEAN
jgi:hypothetical protein